MVTDGPLQVLWFKRDLRLEDNGALVAAAARGPVLPLYVVEPGYWSLPDTSARHWLFLRGCLEELRDGIAGRGGRLAVRSGEAVDVLSSICATHGAFDLHAHMETGNAWTYARDRAVAAWCRTNRVTWTQTQQYGVWRGAKLSRDRWASRWDAKMAEPVVGLPDRVDWVDGGGGELPTVADLGMADDGIVSLQTPGRTAGLRLLDGFLHDRGETYRAGMSSPVTGETACSRLSPHLMAGTLSMREIHHATLTRQAQVSAMPAAERGLWPGAMRSFLGRLHWHCHFMQKLEAEPEIEWLPMARLYEGLRPEADAVLLAAFAAGRTGYPFVDACMRSLRATGWINFRMRAMLMSFASYNLWLPWQASGNVLARLFTDYEPGIHWPQSQMQSGETGINTVRIYSPVKQGHDQDPDGVFTRRWVSELAHLKGKALHEPWTLPVPPSDYPARVVDHLATARLAKDRIYALRRTDDARSEADAVFRKHGSRKPRRPNRPPKRTEAPAQSDLLD